MTRLKSNISDKNYNFLNHKDKNLVNTNDGIKSNISDKNYKFKSQGQKSRQYKWRD